MELAGHLRAVIDGLSELLTQHLKLARVELKEDARELGTQVGKIAAFVPLIVIGYALLCVAGALFLRRFLPLDVAFLIVAGLNLAGGAVGILLAVRRLKERKMLSGSRDELQSTAMVLRSSAQLTAGTNEGTR